MSKNSNQQSWSSLGFPVDLQYSEAFLIGICGGKRKPSDLNEIFTVFVTELQVLLTVSLNAGKCRVNLTVKSLSFVTVLVAVLYMSLATTVQ